MLENVVASHIRSDLSSNSLSFSQSAHRIFHSTETTLFKIRNDIDLVMDCGEVTCILLDLFAAFDTVDHSSFSLVFTCGSVLMAFHLIGPHLSFRSLTVSINDPISAFSTLSCGVPQSSVFGPLLFTLDTVPLVSMISRNSPINTVSFVR